MTKENAEKKISGVPEKDEHTDLIELPVLPLRDVVIYPYVVLPLFVGRPKSIRALEISTRNYNKKICLLAQKNPNAEEVEEGDVYRFGTTCNILQILKLPDGSIKVLVEGEKRVKVKEFLTNREYMAATVEVQPIDEPQKKEQEALIHLALEIFEQYLQFNKSVPQDLLNALSEIKECGRIADAIAAHMALKIEDKQAILEIINGPKRLEKLMTLLKGAIEVLGIEQRISSRVGKQIKKNQRDYYLNEQLKAIQKELGEGDEDLDETKSLSKKIEQSGMPKEVKAKAEAELKRLKLMAPMSAEATVSRSYIDYLLRVPWKKSTKVNTDLRKAEKDLNDDHYGLEKVKELILEYLAVQARMKKVKGPILCLVGAPGVGKTSLGKSIAKATGRKYVRMSLGGMRDEAEIRGHRRTYVGAFPGKIMQSISKTGVRNPLFLLDEIDKIAADFRGDPAAALLEVLDPEQNHAFNDHYLEIDYDLSEVMFVATANTLDIHPALLDRMEIIQLSGYTEDEKLHIALEHLLPKQLQSNGLKESELTLSKEVILDIIRYYTREAGVRNLERELSKICRKAVRKLLTEKGSKVIEITPKNLEEYLGVRKYRFGEVDFKDRIGQVNGLAWMEVGGDLLTIEAVAMTGKGNTTITGQLGNVMQESTKAAISIVRSRAQRLGIPDDYFEKHDIHVHVPEGATPKDGPSAGITMCTALVSMATQIPVKSDFAMTGEITLRGEVLPIGGLKEKLLAAHRGNIHHVIIPEENIKDLKEIPENVKQELEIHPVRWIDQVLELALAYMPEPLKKEEVVAAFNQPSPAKNMTIAKGVIDSAH